MPASSSHRCSSSATAWGQCVSRAVRQSSANFSWRYVFICTEIKVTSQLTAHRTNKTRAELCHTVMTVLSKMCLFVFFLSLFCLFSGVWLPLSVTWNNVRYQSAAHPLTKWWSSFSAGTVGNTIAFCITSQLQVKERFRTFRDLFCLILN